MVRKITNRDEDGAVDFVCTSTDEVADWAEGCAAACPEGYGAGSTMTIVDETADPPKLTGAGWYNGVIWAKVGA
jgi:hypothetical protein